MKKTIGVLFLIGAVALSVFLWKNNDTKGFEIVFVPKDSQGIEVIKEEGANTQCGVYSYEGDIEIIIAGETMTLAYALDSNKITIDDILKQADDDKSSGIANGDMYKDGGSKIYKYPDFTILKCNTLEGNRNLYIGNVEMDINNSAIDAHIKETTPNN